MNKKLPPEIKAELSFELEEEPQIGKPHKVYLKTEWLSFSQKGKPDCELLSTAGLGGSTMFFRVNGRNYKADMKPVFEALIKQVV